MQNDVGPIYCETFLNPTGTFPFEPINTLTSFVPLILGVVALIWLYKRQHGTPLLYLIAAGTAATGFGSVLWHAFRTPLSLSLDVFPGLLTFLLIVWYWPYLLGGRWWSYATITALFGGVYLLAWLFPFGDANGPPYVLFGVVAFVGGILTYFTYKRAGKLCLAGAGLMILLALIAAVVRTLDLATCTIIPFGIHFFWHIFLGTAAFVATIFLAKLRVERESRKSL